MNPEGTARLFARGMMRDGPFPAHYEPFESPVANVRSRRRSGAIRSARVFKDDMEQFGDAKEFPYAATSYRLTEHFHFWTKHVRVNAVLQPEFFVEISEQLAKEKGIKSGGWVRVWSKRGSVKAKAVVTKRIKPLICDGKTGACRRHSAALGLHRRGQEGLRPELADALSSATPISRRRSTRRSWSTSSRSPGRWHEGGDDGNSHSHVPQPSTDVITADLGERDLDPASRRHRYRRPRQLTRWQSSSTCRNASAARPASRRAWSGTTCASEVGVNSASTTTRTT